MFALFFFVATSSAQKSQISLSVGGGLSIPSMESGFTDLYSPGYNLGANMTYNLTTDLGIRGGIRYSHFGIKTDSWITEGHFNSFAVKGDLIYNLSNYRSEVVPYVKAGLGLYFLSNSAKMNYLGYTIESSDSHAYPGTQVGFGIKIKTSSKIGFFAEGELNYILNDGSAKGYMPVMVGIFISL